MTVYYQDDRVTIYHGDCIEVMRHLPDNSVDSIVTDPPYELGFMGKGWDNSGIAYNSEVWENAYRILKPGGHLLAFGGTRTWHRLAVAIEDAGFEVRDSIAYQHSSPVFCRCSVVPFIHDNVSLEGVPDMPKDMATNESVSVGTQQNLQSHMCGGCDQCSQERCINGTHQGDNDCMCGLSKAGGETISMVETSTNPDLFASVQRPVAGSRVGQARREGSGGLDGSEQGKLQSENVRSKQSGMEGRGDLFSEKGQLPSDQIPTGTGLGEANGTQGRLHNGTPSNNGADVRQATDPHRSSESHKSQRTGQPTGEPGAVPDKRGSQAWRGWPICARCGKPLEPPFDAGPLAWQYGSGFPKSHDVSKAIDKAAGAKREVVGKTAHKPGIANRTEGHYTVGGTEAKHIDITAPATPAAQQWQGWGTALKPAFEPIVVARKPLIGTVAENVLAHGTGALNIDGSRIGTTDKLQSLEGSFSFAGSGGANERGKKIVSKEAGLGRWPANVILDESQAAELDKQSGVTRSPTGEITQGGDHFSIGSDKRTRGTKFQGHGDTGGASRFFYVAKAGKKERPNVNGVAHPTVKPMALMQYLVRLVTPPGGTVLEPFAGSGTTIEAALNEGFNVIGIEMTDEYLPLIMSRIERYGDKLL